MDQFATVQLPTRGPSAVFGLAEEYLLVRQGTKLFKIELNEHTVVGEIDVEVVYNEFPAAVLDNKYIEFQPRYTVVVDMTAFSVERQSGLNMQCRNFLVFEGFILLLSAENKLSVINLAYPFARPQTIVQLGPECVGRMVVASGKQLGMINGDDLFLYDLQMQTVVQADMPLSVHWAALLGPGRLICLTGRLFYELNTETSEYKLWKKLKADVSQAKPGAVGSQLYLVDSQGQLTGYRLGLAVHRMCAKQLTQLLLKLKVQGLPKLVLQTNKNDVFRFYLSKITQELQGSNAQQKKQLNLFQACVQLNALVTAMNAMAPSEAEPKAFVSAAIATAMSALISRQRQLQNDLSNLDKDYKNLTEIVCLRQRQILAQDAELKKLDEQQTEMQDFSTLQRIEETKVRDEVYHYKLEQLELLKQEMEEAKRRRDLQIQLEKEEAKQRANDAALLADQTQFIRDLKTRAADARKQDKILKQQLQQAEEQKIAQEADDIVRQRQVLRKQEREQAEALRVKREDEERLKRQIVTQRRNEMNKQQKQALKCSFHTFPMFTKGPSACFIVSADYVVIRQDEYALKVQFKHNQIEQMLALPKYTGQPCAVFQGVFYEIGAESFCFNIKRFDVVEPLERLSVQEELGRFLQSGDVLYACGKSAVFQISLSKLSVERLSMAAEKIVQLKSTTFVRGKNAYELSNGVFKQVHYPAACDADYVEIQDGGHLLSIRGSSIFTDDKECYAGATSLGNAIPCIIGNVAMLCDDNGVLISLSFRE